MGDLPLISVLIVNYNYAHFLGTAIDSVLNSTYDRYEIVVCDDGSSDDSPEIIKRYAREHPDKIRYRLKENGGVASALNAAFAMARGDIIALLDADDYFAPNKLERVAREFTEHPDVGLVVHQMVKFVEPGEMTGLIPQFGGLDSGWLRDKLLATGGHWSFAPASGLVLSRAAAEAVFPIPEDRFRSEADSYIFTQAPMFWPVGAISEPLSYYRQHSSNLTSSERVTPEWAERVVRGIERMCDALAATARANNLPPPDPNQNPVYTEMSFVRDYLTAQPLRVLAADLRKAWRAALRVRTADRGKVTVKPVLLTLVLLLPRRLGARLLELVYLPSAARRWIAERIVALRR